MQCKSLPAASHLTDWHALHAQKYVDTCSSKMSFKIMGINMELVPPFAAMTASTLLGRLSTKCWNIVAETCFHSATRSIVRLGIVGNLGLGRSRRSNSSQRCSMRLSLGPLCRPVKFFHTDLDKPFLYEPHFVHRGIVMLKQERAFPKLLPQSLRFPFNATKGPTTTNHEKHGFSIIPSPPNFTTHWGR